jgi:hypothetical protein
MTDAYMIYSVIGGGACSKGKKEVVSCINELAEFFEQSKPLLGLLLEKR